jgi:hypothetical protein
MQGIAYTVLEVVFEVSFVLQLTVKVVNFLEGFSVLVGFLGFFFFGGFCFFVGF